MKTRFECLLGVAVVLIQPAVFAASPTVTCSADQVLECTSTNGAAGAVAATIQDTDGDGLMVIWSINGDAVLTNILAAGSTSNALTLTLTNTFGFGTNDVSVGVTDDGTNVVICSSLVVVQDTTAPLIRSIVATPSLLWPPNHKMRPVNVALRASDACGPVRWHITEITSNEPIDGVGDGHTSPDWLIPRPHSAMLRAERAGPGSGRIYTITVEVADLANNTTNGTVQIRVPHDRGNRLWRDPHDHQDDVVPKPNGKPAKPGKPPKPAHGHGNSQ
jgi:hypothetical protein